MGIKRWARNPSSNMKWNHDKKALSRRFSSVGANWQVQSLSSLQGTAFNLNEWQEIFIAPIKFKIFLFPPEYNWSYAIYCLKALNLVLSKINFCQLTISTCQFCGIDEQFPKTLLLLMRTITTMIFACLIYSMYYVYLVYRQLNMSALFYQSLLKSPINFNK